MTTSECRTIRIASGRSPISVCATDCSRRTRRSLRSTRWSATNDREIRRTSSSRCRCPRASATLQSAAKCRLLPSRSSSRCLASPQPSRRGRAGAGREPVRSESIKTPGLVLTAHALAFWPVWRWYLARTMDGSDEPWGLAALVAALALTWPFDRRLRLDDADPLLIAAIGLTLSYAILVPFAPPLVRSIVAMAALGCSWVSITDARHKTPVIVALFVLSVPVIASMQFYAGYPLRAITTTAATGLLNAFGMGVEHSGTTMTWQGRSVL